MIRTLRPYRLFEKLGDDNTVTIKIPNIPGSESLTVLSLDTLILLSIARLSQAESILEIGTSRGYTTLNLAVNTSAEIWTVDIEWKPTVFVGDGRAVRIDRLIGTSDDIGGHFDMVFIDADHSYEAVNKDTENALRLEANVIVWHDYNNPTEPDCTSYIDDFARTHDVIHFADSWIAVWAKDGLL